MAMVFPPKEEQLDVMECDYLQTSNDNGGTVNHQMGAGVFLDTESSTDS